MVNVKLTDPPDCPLVDIPGHLPRSTSLYGRSDGDILHLVKVSTTNRPGLEVATSVYLSTHLKQLATI